MTVKTEKQTCRVGIRASTLSITQYHEFCALCNQYGIQWSPSQKRYTTTGDHDQTTDLRTLGSTNFFTKEIDNALVNGDIDIAIHSAKDLPQTLPDELSIICVTPSQSTRDIIVMSEPSHYYNTNQHITIATSSFNREKAVSSKFKNVTFVPLRGDIQTRLSILKNPDIDGVVIAEAALIRLGIDCPNIIVLDHPTTPGQGSLAVVCRRDDNRWYNYFNSLDKRLKRPRILSIGLTKPGLLGTVDHIPLIETKVLASLFYNRVLIDRFVQSDYILITSKQTSHHIHELFKKLEPNLKVLIANKPIIGIGPASFKHHLSLFQRDPQTNDYCGEYPHTSKQLLSTLLPTINGCICYPHSQRSHNGIGDYLTTRNDGSFDFELYTTEETKEKTPDLERYDAIFFSSPSCVDALINTKKTIPRSMPLIPIGLHTEEYIKKCFPRNDKIIQSYR
ncbi:uroporphyrinogen-III synthase [Chlamydiia bacterium]|nr:uroporphyrinogen-III synthase [Chlamydiia bacterium]